MMDSSTLGYVPDLRFRELVSPADSDAIKANVFSVIKLTKTVSEFCAKLANIKEQTAANLVALVELFRKRTNDIKKRPESQSRTFVDAWEHILLEVENEAKDLTELGHVLQKTVAAPLFNSASRKKNFCKKCFAYRDCCQIQINKAEDDLNKKYKDYSDAWCKYNLHDKETLKEHHVAVYHNRHNEFLLQLANVNSMNETLYKNTVPLILDDIETVHKDINKSLLKYLKKFLFIQKDTLKKLGTRMDNAVEVAKKIDVDADLNNFVKFVDHKMSDRNTPFRPFYLPKVTRDLKLDSDTKKLTYLNKALLVDPYTEPMLKRTVAFLRRRTTDLSSSKEKLKAQIKTSSGLLESDLDMNESKEIPVDESDLMNKVNEVRDLTSQLHSFKAQMSLFNSEILDQLGPIPEEHANEIAKQTTITIGRPNDITLLTSKEKPHHFIEHNFLKPAQCYYCKGIIVGLVKQGLKCQNCRMNVHKKCKANVPFCTGSQPAKRVSFSSQGELSNDESLYEEIEPEECSTDGIRSRPAVSSIRSKEVDTSYELPQPVMIPGPLPTGALPARDSIVNKPLPLPPKELGWFVALYDFQREEANDLPLTAGDKVQIIGKSSNEWWEGICKGRKGYFPVSYVEQIEPDDVILRCLYSFDAEPSSDELTLDEGQILVLVEDEGNGWTVGKSKGKKGAFPSSYVEKV